MNDMNLLKVKTQLCLNHRIKNENCRICMEVCPKQAITIEDSPLKVVVSEKCDQCGVCFRHCPAQAIQWNDTKRYPLSSKDGKVEIYCQKIKCDGYVSCLANLTEYELVYLALQADISLCLDKSVCKQCNINIEEEVKTLLEKTNTFLAKINSKKISLDFKDKQVTEQINRRELFSFFFTKMKQSIVESLPIATEATDYRSLLVKELAKQVTDQNSNASPLFFGLQATTCTLCGICTKICKNKALYIEADEKMGVSRLKHDQSRCTGCGACQKICPSNVIKLSLESSCLESICNQRAMVIAEKKMIQCSSCGELIIKNDNCLCDSCQRKKNKKMQAIY